MIALTKSQKIKVSLTVIWAVITALIAGGISEGYFSTFVGVLVFLNLPSLIYWLGFWIWGDGYIFKVVSYPFKKAKSSLNLKGNYSFSIRKAGALLLAVFVFLMLAGLVGSLEGMYQHIFSNFSERTIRNLEATSNIFGLIFAVLLSIKTYKHFSRLKLDEMEQNKTYNTIILSRKQKLIRNSASLIAVLISAFLITLAATEQYKSTADGFGYVLGEVIGFWLVVSLIGYAVAKKMPWFQTAPISPYAVFFLIATIYIAYPQYKEAKDGRTAMLSMADTIEKDYIAASTDSASDISVSPIPVPSSSEIAPLMDWVNKGRQQGAAIFNDYNNSFPASFEETLSPSTLSDLAKIQSSQHTVQEMLTVTDSYKERVINHFNGLETELQSLDVEPSIKEEALSGFLKKKEENIETYTRYFTLQEAMLHDFSSLLKLMETAYGSYKFDETGQPVFTYDQHLKEYNDLISSIQSYVLRQKEWGEEVASKELALAKRFKEDYK